MKLNSENDNNQQTLNKTGNNISQMLINKSRNFEEDDYNNPIVKSTSTL